MGIMKRGRKVVDGRDVMRHSGANLSVIGAKLLQPIFSFRSTGQG